MGSNLHLLKILICFEISLFHLRSINTMNILVRIQPLESTGLHGISQWGSLCVKSFSYEQEDEEVLEWLEQTLQPLEVVEDEVDDKQS